MIRLPICKTRIASIVQLSEAERHYLIRVLRLEIGDSIEVFDGDGARYPARLLTLESLELGPPSKENRELRRVVLAQSLAKGDKMDLIVQKATELGASEIAPFVSKRTIVHLEAGRAADRIKRWQRIADSAARQCDRADTPTVREITEFPALVSRCIAEDMLTCILYEDEQSVRLSQVVRSTEKPAVLVVGPEGGFCSEEIAAARALGASTATLGQRIVRTETAGMAALTIVRFLDGDLG